MRKAVTRPFQFRSPENGYFIDMASKKRVVLDLNAKVKVIEARENDKMTVKQNTSIHQFKIEVTPKTRVVDW
jgi:hypothetical protein